MIGVQPNHYTINGISLLDLFLCLGLINFKFNTTVLKVSQRRNVYILMTETIKMEINVLLVIMGSFLIVKILLSFTSTYFLSV